MKTGWALKPLHSICEDITVGHVGSMAKEYKESGIPFLRSQNIRPFQVSLENLVFIDETFHRALSKSQLRPGDLAIVRTGYPGTAAVIPESLPVSNCSDLVIVRPGPNIDPNFLALFFNSNQGKELVAGRIVGAAQKHFNITTAKQVSIPLPSLQEQQRIVAILDEAFEGIATAKANTEKNLQNAKEVFDGQLRSVFSGRGEDWSDYALGDIGKTQTGSTPKTSDPGNYGDKIPFVKPGDFNRDGSIDYEKDGLSDLGKNQARIVPAGSALMVCIGATIGKAGYTDRNVTTNQQINAVTPTNGVDAKWIYYQMITSDFQRRVLHASGQATLPIINKSKWSSLTIAVPKGKEEQDRLIGLFDSLLEESKNLESVYLQKLAALDELKQSLLHRTFNGDL